jgi:phosphotransferase system enzyme I (PtsI)
VIRQVSRQQGVEVLEHLLKLPTAKEVNRYMEEDMAQRFPDIFGPPVI